MKPLPPVINVRTVMILALEFLGCIVETPHAAQERSGKAAIRGALTDARKRKARQGAAWNGIRLEIRIGGSDCAEPIRFGRHKHYMWNIFEFGSVFC